MNRHIRREVERIIDRREAPTWDRRFAHGTVVLTASANTANLMSFNAGDDAGNDLEVQSLQLHRFSLKLVAVLDGGSAGTHSGTLVLATARYSDAGLVPPTQSQIAAQVQDRDHGISNFRALPLVAAEETIVPASTGINSRALANLTPRERLYLPVVAYNLSGSEKIQVAWSCTWSERRSLGDRND